MKKCIVIFIFFLLIQNIFLGAIYSNAQQIQIINEEKAKLLKELGIFKGSNNGFELEREPTRLEGAVILVRLMGKEEEALKQMLLHPFQDVPEWASPYIGYMHQNNLTKGKSSTEYGSNELLSLQQFTTFILRALGYQDNEGDFQWDKAVEKAKDIGLLSELEVNELLNKESFMRDDVVGICFNALKTNQKEKGTSLLYSLVYEEGCIAGDLAEDTGLMENNHEVVFKDKVFEEIIRDVIKKPAGKIYRKDISGIGILNIEGKVITSFNGIEEMSALTVLNIKNSSVSDLSIIGRLTNLRSLSLSKSNIKDITFLSGLINLEILSLNENEISNISALEDMANLDWLYLSKNKVTDLKPIRDLTNLTELVIAYNEIEDLTPISNLINLTYLYAGNNKIEDIKPLQNLVQLTALFIPDNQISDITPLCALDKLTELDISSNQVTEIQALKGMLKMENLNLNRNQIHDLTPLQDMSGLTDLYVQRNGFEDISVLSDKSNLSYADLSFNQIKNLPSLNALKKLTSINLMDNQIEDISPLAAVNHMSGTIELSINKIQDIKPLSGFDNLTGLFLTGNSISDITYISTMRCIKTLDLRGNMISNLSALKDLGQVENLYLSRNPITDYSAVKGYYSKLIDKDFDMNVPDITTKDPLKLTPQRENEIVEELNSLAVKNPIDGAYNDPYNLKPTEAIMFIIFNSKDDLSLFINTITNVQKKFMNQFIQNNYGDFLGCEVVHCYVIYHSQKFAEADVSYGSLDEELSLKLIPAGEYMKVVKRQGSNFVDYYQN